MARINFRELRTELAECRRRLGPHTALQDDTNAAALNLASVARTLANVIEVVEHIVDEQDAARRTADARALP